VVGSGPKIWVDWKSTPLAESYHKNEINLNGRYVLHGIRNCCAALSYALHGRTAAQFRGNVDNNNNKRKSEVVVSASSYLLNGRSDDELE